MYQSRSIPIPVYAPIASSSQEPSVNFIGRLAREILRATDPKTTYYVDKKSTWYDLKTKEEVVSLRLFKKLELSLNTFGLHGLDSLYSFMISKDLQSIMANVTSSQKAFEGLYSEALKQMEPLDTVSSKQGFYLLSTRLLWGSEL